MGMNRSAYVMSFPMHIDDVAISIAQAHGEARKYTLSINVDYEQPINTPQCRSFIPKRFAILLLYDLLHLSVLYIKTHI